LRLELRDLPAHVRLASLELLELVEALLDLPLAQLRVHAPRDDLALALVDGERAALRRLGQLDGARLGLAAQVLDRVVGLLDARLEGLEPAQRLLQLVPRVDRELLVAPHFGELRRETDLLLLLVRLDLHQALVALLEVRE